MRGRDGKYFDREINTEPHTSSKPDACLKEAEATGPFSDQQKVWSLAACRQKACDSDQTCPFPTG